MLIKEIDEETGSVYFKSIRPLEDKRKISEAKRDLRATLRRHLRCPVDKNTHPYTYRLLHDDIT